MNKDTQISMERVKREVQNRFNPIRGLDPMKLSSILDAWDAGRISDGARLFDKVLRRDDVLLSVSAKRIGAPTRRDCDVVPIDDSPRAAKHAEAIQYCLDNLTATHALEGDFEQGLSGLLRQMMSAVGSKWGVHNLIWQPSPSGLTVEARFAPLWFFEHRTGRLRYLETDGAVDGTDLQPGAWMVTSGAGIMEGCSVPAMFKSMAHKDWVAYNEKFGLPGILGKTSATQGSAEWNLMHDAVRDFFNDWAAVASTGSEIEVITVGSGATMIPMEKLIERCDKRLMSIWRGGDLSTQSASDSVGALAQKEEGEILEADDLEMLENTLNRKLIPYIIRYTYGDTVPLARVQIRMPEPRDAQNERATDLHFKDAGLPLDIDDFYERHSRPRPATDAAPDSLIYSSAPVAAPVVSDSLANESGDDAAQLVQASVEQSLDLRRSDLDPVADIFAKLTASEVSDDDLLALAEDVALSLPELIGAIDARGLAKIFEGALGSAIVLGAEDVLNASRTVDFEKSRESRSSAGSNQSAPVTGVEG